MSHWWKEIAFLNSLTWQDRLLYKTHQKTLQAWWFVCQFITFYAWRCMFNVVSVHGWLTRTDVRDISMLPFASHMWEVGNKPMCAYLWVFTCMQYLMLHLIFTHVLSLLVHVGRQTLQMKTVDRLQALYQHLCLPCLKLLCILKVLWPWLYAVCSVTFQSLTEYKPRWLF